MSYSRTMASGVSALSADLMACLGREGVTDLHLRSSDGIKVPAFRAVLACRSDVFRQMRCGRYKEATAEEVALDYSG